MRRVVVTGCGVVSAIGSGRENFFSALQGGQSGIGDITLFDAASFPVRIAAEVKNLDRDSVLGQYPAAEAIRDRKVHLLLAAFSDLLADAGVNPDFLSAEGAGLNLGVSLEVLPVADFKNPPQGGAFQAPDFFRQIAGSPFVLQTPLDTASGILIRRHHLSGPSYVNCSACAASAMTIGHSFHLIRQGQADIYCCGGFDSMINPLGIGGFALLGALSTSNELGASACRPFDARRNGAVIGEGAGLILLEELTHARQRGATIYAEVVGYGSSLDAYKPTDPDPDGYGAMLAMKKALVDAGIDPGKIDYINAHGTSTPKNDEIETKAIRKLFGVHANRIPVSSTKSMIGHLIAAAGAVEFIASLLGFACDSIPPTINLENPDPFCDLDYVPGKAREWHGSYIMSNSFGFGGQNAALVLRRWQEES